MATNKYLVYTDEEWSALYIDGKLEIVGDHYLIDNRLQEILGVVTIESDAFMLGGSTHEDVAQTIDQIEAFEDAASKLRAEASQLRSLAQEMQQRADSLEAEAGSR